MPAIVRLNDMSTGCCAPPRANSQGASKTLTDGKPTHCQGHAWMPHACPNSPPHGANTVNGSPKTIVEGRGVARVGDSISCGSSCATGSPKSFSG